MKTIEPDQELIKSLDIENIKEGKKVSSSKMKKSEMKMVIKNQEKKAKIYFSSKDIILYVVFTFLIGVSIGLAIGRYKQIRMQIIEQRLHDTVKQLESMRIQHDIVKKNLTEVGIPILNKMKNRSFEYGCSNKLGVVKFKKTFKKNPDVILCPGGIQIDMKTSSDTFWHSSVDYITGTSQIDLKSFSPKEVETSNIFQTCWFAVPGKDVE